MNIVKGKEKAWAALLSGGFVAAVSTLALYFASLPGMVDAPDKATIAGAINGVVVAVASAVATYLATNSTPTNISVPADPVHPDDFTSTPKE